ncbi:MAG: hypothetical protein E7637_09140 [Ruminococcaceae bacterium]|nr:hypothetical protein [Oscillospiraceae bacterium]
MKKNMLWNAAGNLIYLGCQWLVTVLVTVLGNFGDAGLLSIAMSISATFQTVAMFGIRNYQVSDVENKYTDTCYVHLRLITCAAALLGCMGFAVICRYERVTLLCVFFFMLFRLAENFSDVLHGIAQKNDRLDIAGKAFAIKGIGLLAVFCGTYVAVKELYAGLAAMAAFSLLTTVCYDFFAVRRLSSFRLMQRGSNWLRLGMETLPLCAYLFLSAAIATAPKLLLEKQCGEDLLGAYSSIFAPAMLIQAAMGYVYTPFAQVLGVKRKDRDTRGFVRLSLQIAGVILVLAAVMTVAAYFLGDFLLIRLFGEKIRPYTTLLIPILFSIIAISFFGFLSMISIVLRDFIGLLLGCAVGFLIAIVLTPSMITAYSANGASYGLILSTCVAAVILIVGIARKLTLKKYDEKEKTL